MRKTRLPIVVCLILIAVYTGVFSWLGIARYESTFSYDWRDEAVDNQMMFNTAKGDPLLSTVKGLHRHHRHFRPMFLLAAVPYVLYPDAKTWYVEIALISALGALAAFRIGQKVAGSPYAGLLASAVWLAWPALHQVTLSNLDPETFAAAIWLFAIAAYLDKKFWTFLLAAVLALCCKETQGPVLAGFGVVMLIRRARPKFWVTSVILGAVWFLIAVKIVIPSYFPEFATVYNRFIGVDGTNFPSGFLTLLFTQPVSALRQMFSAEHLTLLTGLARPLGYLFVFSPLCALGAGSIILQILLLKDPLPIRQAHIISAILPFVFWATIAGIGRLSEWLAKIDLIGTKRKSTAQYALLTAVLAVCLSSASLPGPFGLHQNYGRDANGSMQASNALDAAFRTPTGAEKRAADIIRSISPDAVVVANSRLLLLLSSRRTLYEFGNQKEISDFNDAGLVVLWFLKADCPTCTYSELTPENLRLAASLVESGRFGVAGYDPAFAVLVSKSLPQQGFVPDPALDEPFLARIKELSARLAAGKGLPTDELRR